MSCLVVKTQRKSAKCRQVNVAPINSGGWLLLQPAKAFGANDTCPWSAKPRKKNENDVSLSRRSCTVRVTPCEPSCVPQKKSSQRVAARKSKQHGVTKVWLCILQDQLQIRMRRNWPLLQNLPSEKNNSMISNGIWSAPTSIAKYSPTLSERKFCKRINWLP